MDMMNMRTDNMAHEDHVMAAIHKVEDYAIDVVETLGEVPKECRCAEHCELLSEASDMLKDMMEARANISKIRHYSNIAKQLDHSYTGGREAWELAYAAPLADIEALTHHLRHWMKYREDAAKTGDMTAAKTAEKHLAEAFAAHRSLTSKIMSLNATDGEKAIITSYVKTHA